MKNNNDIIVKKNKVFFIMILSIVFFIIIIIRLSYLQLYNTKASINNLNKLSKKIVYGDSMPRGRILDRNLNIIVDNVGIYTMSYKKSKNISKKQEIKMAYDVSKKIDLDYQNVRDRNLKEFWLELNLQEADKKITDQEILMLNKGKLSLNDIYELKIERITKNELDKLNEEDKKAAYIYYLMNNGYSYDNKLIKEELTDEEYSYFIQNKYDGFEIKTNWKRIYPYGDTLKGILGVVSTSKQGVPRELKSDYLKKGYELNDRVGLSYLELQYEEYLRGTKDEYLLENGKKTLIKKGKRGKDIVLSIDINLQLELDNILKEEVLKAKKELNTNYYDHSSVVISDPTTGLILAISSKKVSQNKLEYDIYDNTTAVLTTSVMPGSIVKGASMLVGYKTGKLKIGDSYQDKCIKFKNTPNKCSWSRNLGYLNDIKALELSSNSYQFQLALKVANVNYSYNMPIKISDDALNTYKGIFKELGLGDYSKIDLPNETKGYSSTSNDAGLLLNYSIGQYDTYSVLQLTSYINTIINNGNRYKLNLVSEVRNPTKDDSVGSIYSKYNRILLNKVDIDDIYFNRVKEGFKSVLKGSLGRGYMGNISNPAGKTGTAESFYDSDFDGIIDKETYSKTFVGYAPYDNPKFSIVSISPNVGRKSEKSSFTSNVNKRIVSRICEKFFEIYK